ncbi:4'-phosphopantetheinyl transferase superfamily protein [Marinobacter halodurans]|uniref:Enterobactin synthase component D n=1 Tax=Marinobacter halodurans TaxID=2528979 RepID=A0ABY1ZI85_9GAMM|nr:4'-phosphopantetheinyl transferase superfamily protein [Marinobacter halodurans]TBW49999.1 4'-phosphopantetheinyl transferase superfamily protein [Marinobacter halodurans]
MTSLPSCCSNLGDDWPWRQPLPGLQLISLDFDADRLRPGDFRDCNMVPPATVQRAVSKRQTEYLAGRLCAREALHRTAKLAIYPGTGEDRAPRWPQGMVGSITHTQGWAAAIVGHDRDYAGVGLDAEVVMPDSRARKLAHQILTPNEITRFADALSGTPGACLTRIFSLKECLFKALYPITLKRFYFEHAEVLTLADDGRARLRLRMDLSEGWPAGRELDALLTQSGDRILGLVAVTAA